jgi:hypothetical protein
MPPPNIDEDNLDGEDGSNPFGDRDSDNGVDTTAGQPACKAASVAAARVRG